MVSNRNLARIYRVYCANSDLKIFSMNDVVKRERVEIIYEIYGLTSLYIKLANTIRVMGFRTYRMMELRPS